ncbi:MAG: hypothetical protein ACREQ5_02915 [Candidatus Dormibacteria bacterium]
MNSLLLGCGHQRKKLLVPQGAPKEFINLYTVDINPDCKPDVIMDLMPNDWTVHDRISGRDEFLDRMGLVYFLKENFFDEVHAYEVLEHIGRQGDIRSFFAHFWQIWKCLKPGGYLCATVPSRYSQWLWGDPGHTRAILQCSLIFLDRSQYTEQLGKTAMSDYRNIWHGDYKIIYSNDDKKDFHCFVLQAIKPIRDV